MLVVRRVELREGGVEVIRQSKFRNDDTLTIIPVPVGLDRTGLLLVSKSLSYSRREELFSWSVIFVLSATYTLFYFIKVPIICKSELLVQ